MKIIWQIIKGQIFKSILYRLSESDLRQRSAVPAFVEKLEFYLTPYLEALPKAVNFVFIKLAIAIVMLSSFFALFSESLRQIDVLGTLAPSAYLVGYLTLFLVSIGAFWLVKAPGIEQKSAGEKEQIREGSLPGGSPMPEPGLGGLDDYSNVKPLRSGSAFSAAGILLKELRAERERFSHH